MVQLSIVPPLIVGNDVHEMFGLHTHLPILVLLQLLHKIQHSHLLHLAVDSFLLARALRNQQCLSSKFHDPHQNLLQYCFFPIYLQHCENLLDQVQLHQLSQHCEVFPQQIFENYQTICPCFDASQQTDIHDDFQDRERVIGRSNYEQLFGSHYTRL